jgi:hypothetical protein
MTVLVSTQLPAIPQRASSASWSSAAGTMLGLLVSALVDTPDKATAIGALGCRNAAARRTVHRSFLVCGRDGEHPPDDVPQFSARESRYGCRRAGFVYGAVCLRIGLGPKTQGSPLARSVVTQGGRLVRLRLAELPTFSRHRHLGSASRPPITDYLLPPLVPSPPKPLARLGSSAPAGLLSRALVRRVGASGSRSRPPKNRA